MSFHSIIMTRKCVLCKETNYRNTYSFFSAPKDPETRKKWQNAIAIENYAVTDDTYVCSKHFHKKDIITHWVSGVPPHVITIKYKKCRLRPGAVPGRNYHLEHNSHDEEHSDDSDINMNDYITFKQENAESSDEKKENFLIPRTDETLHRKGDKKHKAMSLNYQFSHHFDDYNYTLINKNSSIKMESSKDRGSINMMSQKELKGKESSEKSFKQINKVFYLKDDGISNTDLIKHINSENVKEEPSRLCNENSYSDVSRRGGTSEGDDTSTEMWEQRDTLHKNTFSCEKSLDNTFKTMEDLYIENQVLNTLNYDHLDPYYTSYNDEENEMLFEDLLEVCTEVILPRGWSCLVTSKGHTTTIVYLYMGMTKNGMPFAEKQVFVKSDMILRCAAVNSEINPLMHNLIREGKHLKVQSLLDVEELIDEFDQRIVCQGIYNMQGFKEVNGVKIAYKDGIKWRHILCPLIVNNDSSRCTRCITLSHMLVRKSKSFPPFRYNPLVFAKGQQKLHVRHQTRKRTRKHDHRHDFISVFKK